MTWWKKTPIKIVVLFFLPVLLFIVWSFLTYPLQPHCSLGTSLLSCTPYCEPTSYMEDGRPADYKVVPCFHNEPTSFQKITYKYSLIYYFLIFLLTLILAIKVGIKKFFVKILRIVFAPFVLIRESKKKSVVSRILTIAASFFLIIEWGFGYIVVIQTLTGIKILNW